MKAFKQIYVAALIVMLSVSVLAWIGFDSTQRFTPTTKTIFGITIGLYLFGVIMILIERYKNTKHKD